MTLRHGGAFPFEVERLWTQLARRTRNINPILDFLLHLGMATALQVCGWTGKCRRRGLCVGGWVGERVGGGRGKR